MTPRFRKIEACTYEVRGSGYRVERMENGFWDAYLPDAYGHRLWQSVHHSTRELAAMAVSAEQRRVKRAVSNALKEG